jgi:hypothetical protein
MGRCIIYKADYDYFSGSITYMADCDDFDEVSEGEHIPEYTWGQQKISEKLGFLKALRIDA